MVEGSASASVVHKRLGIRLPVPGLQLVGCTRASCCPNSNEGARVFYVGATIAEACNSLRHGRYPCK